jgi:hypothetical protein
MPLLPEWADHFASLHGGVNCRRKDTLRADTFNERKLEEYLGVTLFERSRAHVVLTADGAKVLRLARGVSPHALAPEFQLRGSN